MYSPTAPAPATVSVPVLVDAGVRGLDGAALKKSLIERFFLDIFVGVYQSGKAVEHLIWGATLGLREDKLNAKSARNHGFQERAHRFTFNSWADPLRIPEALRSRITCFAAVSGAKHLPPPVARTGCQSQHEPRGHETRCLRIPNGGSYCDLRPGQNHDARRAPRKSLWVY
jgi:hypothetical protein